MSVIQTTPERESWTTAQSAPWISEDWLSVVIGLLIFVLALAVLANVDLIGWVVTTSVWTNLGQALGTASKAYAPLGGAGAPPPRVTATRAMRELLHDSQIAATRTA